MKEKPLSEKEEVFLALDDDRSFFLKEDVKEAVEKLKEEIKEETWFPTRKLQIERIDKIFGSFE